MSCFWTDLVGTFQNCPTGYHYLIGGVDSLGEPMVQVSIDGTAWVALATGLPSGLTVYQSAGSVGHGAVYIATSDGVTLHVKKTSDFLIWNDIPQEAGWLDATLAYDPVGNSLAAAVADGTFTRKLFVTYDDGATWLGGVETIEEGYWSAFTHAGSFFVAMGNDHDNLPWFKTSEDGVTWTYQVRVDLIGEVRALAYGGGKYVAVCADHPTTPTASFTLTSTDCATWTKNDYGYNSGRAIAFSGTHFVTSFAQTLGGDLVAHVSTDGVTWTPVTTSFDAGGITAIAGGDLFVAAGFGAVSGVDEIQTSADGTTWATATLDPAVSTPTIVTATYF